MREALDRYRELGVSSVVFGDLFLKDVREYREQKLSMVGMKVIFPLWQLDTTELAEKFLALGFRAVVTCVDTQALDAGFTGRIIDGQFLQDLPAGVDPCGENGEFHTFVFDGPIFREAIAWRKGETVMRDGRFCFCDLLPVR